MSNLKDTITTIAGLLGAVAVGLIALPADVIGQLPSGIYVAAAIVAALSTSIIGFFNGRNADGTKKSIDQILSQKHDN